MTILHAHSEPQFTGHLRAVLAEANGAPHSVDIAVGYFYLSGFAQVAGLLAERPGRVRILIGRTDRPTRQEIAAGYSPQESAAGYHEDQNRREEAAAPAMKRWTTWGAMPPSSPRTTPASPASGL